MTDFAGFSWDTRKKTFAILVAIIALVGVGLTIYATMHHIELKQSGETDFGCNINSELSCDDVARSEYSEVFNIPLGIWGLGYFVAVLFLLLMAFIKEKNDQDSFQSLAAMALIGVVVSVALFCIAQFSIGALCITCIGIYGCCIAQAAVVFLYRDMIPMPIKLESLTNGGFVAAIVVAVGVFGYNMFRPAPAPQMSIDQNDPNLMYGPTQNEIRVFRSAYAGLGEDYRKGGDEAKVVIHEFADFQCPACERVSHHMKRLAQEFGDRILVVFKNYPLDKSCNASLGQQIHPHACRAAILARCAGRNGKFWEYHDRVFANQRQLDGKMLRDLAKGVGLSDQQINECNESKDLLAKVREDIDIGSEVGVTGTPSIFINGRQFLGGRSYEGLRKEVERLLGNN